MRISTRAALILVLCLAGCAASSYNFPTPIVMPNGNRGFGMTGHALFTSSEASAKAEIEQALTTACRGPIRIATLTLRRADNPISRVPHIAYDVTAECL